MSRPRKEIHQSLTQVKIVDMHNDWFRFSNMLPNRSMDPWFKNQEEPDNRNQFLARRFSEAASPWVGNERLS